ncbi:MAG: hypothetical protein HYZ90_06610 [Candidatus Omnitrophica bacterium]|nr:hypothetical protein [Candidatus Omnitrophota bacterium]
MNKTLVGRAIFYLPRFSTDSKPKTKGVIQPMKKSVVSFLVLQMVFLGVPAVGRAGESSSGSGGERMVKGEMVETSALSVPQLAEIKAADQTMVSSSAIVQRSLGAAASPAGNNPPSPKDANGSGKPPQNNLVNNAAPVALPQLVPPVVARYGPLEAIWQSLMGFMAGGGNGAGLVQSLQQWRVQIDADKDHYARAQDLMNIDRLIAGITLVGNAGWPTYMITVTNITTGQQQQRDMIAETRADFARILQIYAMPTPVAQDLIEEAQTRWGTIQTRCYNLLMGGNPNWPALSNNQKTVLEMFLAMTAFDGPVSMVRTVQAMIQQQLNQILNGLLGGNGNSQKQQPQQKQQQQYQKETAKGHHHFHRGVGHPIGHHKGNVLRGGGKGASIERRRLHPFAYRE